MSLNMLVVVLSVAFMVIESSDVVHAEHLERTVNGNNRHKREAECALKYSTITDGHSACLRTNKAQKSGVTEAEKGDIVDLHNRERRDVNPKAANMMMMRWDNEIAETAQRWAENCNLEHDGNYKRYAFGRFTVGQNLAKGQSSWAAAIQAWTNEKSGFTYGKQSSSVTGHYTQMIWAETSKIGCGYAKCERDFYVCNYGPAGNIAGKENEPYKSGNACGDCGSNCNNNLCDCKEKVCMNGGDMDLSTCTCSCKKDLPFFLKPDCGLNCTGAKDPFYCSLWAGICESVSNVPQECPNTCKWCPTAAYTPPVKVTTDTTKVTTETSKVTTETSKVTSEDTGKTTTDDTSGADLLVPMSIQIFILVHILYVYHHIL